MTALSGLGVFRQHPSETWLTWLPEGCCDGGRGAEHLLRLARA
jgi:hypothetical protein